MQWMWKKLYECEKICLPSVVKKQKENINITKHNEIKKKVVEENAKIKTIICSDNNTLILSTDGKLYGFGNNIASTGSKYFSETFDASNCDVGTGICTGIQGLSDCGGGGLSIYRISKTFINTGISIFDSINFNL